MFFSGTFIAKSHYTYGIIEKEFRPINDLTIRGNLESISIISTAGIIISPDGILSTNVEYNDEPLVSSFSSMWFSK